MSLTQYFSAGQSQDPNAYPPLTYAEVQATGTTTTSSGTYTTLNSMTTVPVEGIHQVWFSCSLSNTGSGLFNTPEETYFSVYVNGVQVTHSERESTAGDGGRHRTVACQCRIEVDGSQTVEVRWRVTGGTATCYARTLTTIKLADES